MPELPDLQVFSSNLTRLLRGKKISKINLPVKGRVNVSTPVLKKKLIGQTVKSVERVGKELHVTFNKGDKLGLHLMLHGNLYLFEKKNTNKHTILELIFQNGQGLALTDWQRKATPTLNPEKKEAPDALSKEINFKFLKEVLQSRATIKNILLDQKTIRGIGNAYADEILWDARISPFSIANKIPDAKIKALVKSIRKVLVNAEKQIRKKNPDIITGEVRDFLLIHNSKKKQSPGGAPIEYKMVGGRKTYFTKEQEEF